MQSPARGRGYRCTQGSLQTFSPIGLVSVILRPVTASRSPGRRAAVAEQHVVIGPAAPGRRWLCQQRCWRPVHRAGAPGGDRAARPSAGPRQPADRSRTVRLSVTDGELFAKLDGFIVVFHCAAFAYESRYLELVKT